MNLYCANKKVQIHDGSSMPKQQTDNNSITPYKKLTSVALAYSQLGRIGKTFVSALAEKILKNIHIIISADYKIFIHFFLYLACAS